MTKQEKIPQFANEDDEREFWATHDSTDYADTATPVILEYDKRGTMTSREEIMEAKDTVMGDRDFKRLVKEYPNASGIQEVIPIILKAQAEISFKAGYKQALLQNDWINEQGRLRGIREVVEWIEDNLDFYMGAEFESVSWEEDWQAKLKEWGIK